jgi:hypothetical protein
LDQLEVCFLFQRLKLRKIHRKNWVNKLAKSSDEFMQQRKLKNGLTPLERSFSLNFVTQRVQGNWLTCTSDPDFIMGLHHYGRIGHSGTTATATTEPCLG